MTFLCTALKVVCMNDNHDSLPKPTFKFNLICASKCKRFALDVAQSSISKTRAKKFTRVSKEFLVACEANLKEFIRQRVESHPSKGKTLM